ncbi:MAG: membrane dipeptidase, partial [Gemmatimonadetes bacterium]|nr:membrane dipeptidase [Gemmatimonadota bacterium]
MHRRTFVSNAAILGAAAALRPTASGAQPAPRPLVMDAMGELRNEYDDALIRDMLGTGMRAITVTLCDPKPTGAEGLELAIDGVVEYDRMIATRARFFLKATSVRHIDDARRQGKMAVFYLFQNSDQFGDDLDRVDLFYRLGVRSSQVTYNDRNRVGTGCRAGEDGGLTPFGAQLVEKMNAIGMLVDLSHANQRTMAETAAASRKPVIISHTACMAVHQNIRNASDDVLRAVAKTGGVIGICQMRPFLTTKKSDNLHAYFDHIDHAVKVAGIEHV